MKERPILFSAPMVRAILDGSKTQTRRIRGLEAVNINPDARVGAVHSHHNLWDFVMHDNGTQRGIKCPYGQPGDQLWVRETFKFRQGGPVYDAAGGVMDSMDDELTYRATNPKSSKSWTPSIHMPRWASRIHLEITGIRVERLQACSGIDAKAEGVAIPAHIPHDGADLDWAIREYKALWESINGEGSWDANPWVWVVEFKVIKP
jgi:hypothetical protein